MMMRCSMLFDSDNDNDYLVYLQEEIYTILGRFDQTEFPKTKCEKRGRGSDGIQGVRTGSLEPVLRISARSVNPLLIYRNLCISISQYNEGTYVGKF